VKLPCLVNIETGSRPVLSPTLGTKTPSWERCVSSISRKTWVVNLAAGEGPARRGLPCLPSDYYVEHEDVLLGVLPNAPDAGFGNAVSNADSGVGVRPLRRWVAAGKGDFP